MFGETAVEMTPHAFSVTVAQWKDCLKSSEYTGGIMDSKSLSKGFRCMPSIILPFFQRSCEPQHKESEATRKSSDAHILESQNLQAIQKTLYRAQQHTKKLEQYRPLREPLNLQKLALNRLDHTGTQMLIDGEAMSYQELSGSDVIEVYL